ncbi:MAG: hypothetical protein ACF8R7_16640 [Phycisphaerales bacterium JB039]
MRSTEIIVRLRAEPGGPDRYGRLPAVRLRLLLRTILRLYGWRAVELRPAPGADSERRT